LAKYLVRIDPKTIRKNPNAGQSVHYCPGRTSAHEKRVIWLGGNEYRIEEYVGTGFDGNGNIVKPVLRNYYEYFGSRPPNGHKTMHQEMQAWYSLTPEPNYLYDYLPTMVVCKCCMAGVLHTELNMDYNDWDYEKGCASEPGYSCAHCKTWNSCELEYEKLTDEELAKRMTQGINQVVIEEITLDKESHEERVA